MPLVVDCSVALAWFAPSQATDLSRRSRAVVEDEGAIVPFIFPIEFANALLMLRRRGRLSPDDEQLAVEGLRFIGPEVDMMTCGTAVDKLLPLATSYRLTVYDAAYLELALRSGLPLATRDRDLDRAAREAGVPLLAA